VTHPHNAYLRALLDTGAVGLVLLCLYQLHLWRGFRQLSRDEQLSPTMRGLFEGAAAGLVGLLIAGVAGSALTPVPEQSFLWLSIGLMYGVLWKRRVAEKAARAAERVAIRRAAMMPPLRPRLAG
jgi:O-antigen ligase